jgi:hypothetical protein
MPVHVVPVRWDETRSEAHVLPDHDEYLPRFAVIEATKVPEIKMASQFRFEAGTIVVCDRG